MHRRVMAASALLAVVATSGVLTGCSSAAEGAGDASASATVDAAAARCRAQWRALERDIDTAAAGQDGASAGAVHQALASRYDGLAASAAYWRVNATAKGCGAMLSGQQTALLQLRMLESKASAYDTVLRTQRALAQRTKLSTSGLAETKPVVAAYASLSRLAPVVATAVAPGVATLDTFDPSIPAEVQQAVSNLALLARASDGWPGWSTAMNRVAAFQRQQQARADGAGASSSPSPNASPTPSATGSAG